MTLAGNEGAEETRGHLGEAVDAGDFLDEVDVALEVGAERGDLPGAVGELARPRRVRISSASVRVIEPPMSWSSLAASSATGWVSTGASPATWVVASAVPPAIFEDEFHGEGGGG
jgi:hypothetical protein